MPTECDRASPGLVQVDNVHAVIRVSANQGQDRNVVSFPQNLQKHARNAVRFGASAVNNHKGASRGMRAMKHGETAFVEKVGLGVRVRTESQLLKTSWFQQKSAQRRARAANNFMGDFRVALMNVDDAVQTDSVDAVWVLASQGALLPARRSGT